MYKGQYAVYSNPIPTQSSSPTANRSYSKTYADGSVDYTTVTYTPTHTHMRPRTSSKSVLDDFFDVNKEPHNFDLWSYVSFLGSEEFVVLFNDTKSHPENDKNHKAAFTLKKYQVYSCLLYTSPSPRD